MCAGSCDSVGAVFVAVYENVTQIVVQAKLQETVTGTCYGETVLGVVIHNQTMGFCAVSESAVVVSTSTGTVLNAHNIIVVVYHLMQQCSTDFFDGSGKSTGSKIYLMEITFLGNPGIFSKGEMPITFWSALDSYSWA